MSSIPNAWDRIHQWLRSHAPKILTNLNPGASELEIASAERALGIVMPDDWRELYHIHNGMNEEANQGSLFYGMSFLSLERVLANYTREAENKRELGNEYTPESVRAADPGIQLKEMHHKDWIPLAHDWGDTLIRVDLNPAASGKSGQVIFTDHVYRVAILLAPSICQFLDTFANDLECGRYFLKPDALEDGDEFLDCAAELDVVNWWKSPRWKHLER